MSEVPSEYVLLIWTMDMSMAPQLKGMAKVFLGGQSERVDSVYRKCLP